MKTELPELQKIVADFVEQHDLESNINIRLLDLVSEVGELSKEFLKKSQYGKINYMASDEWTEELIVGRYLMLYSLNRS